MNAQPVTPTSAIPTTPQPGDVSNIAFRIGQRIAVPSVGVNATITRIHYHVLWITYDDGEPGCVASADVTAIPASGDLPFKDEFQAWATFTVAPDMPDMATLRQQCAAAVNYTPAAPTAEDRAFMAACAAERKVRNWAYDIVRNAGGDVSEVNAAPICALAEWYNEVNPDTTVSIKQFAVLEDEALDAMTQSAIDKKAAETIDAAYGVKSAPTPAEQRLAEIYSYYLDERYLDDLSGTFAEWLSTSMYAREHENICAMLFTDAYAALKAQAADEPVIDPMTQSAIDKRYAETVQHPPCHPLTALLSNPDASDSALLDSCYGQTVTFMWRGCPGVYPRQQMTGVIVGLETWRNGVRMLQVKAAELNTPKWIDMRNVQFVGNGVES